MFFVLYATFRINVQLTKGYLEKKDKIRGRAKLLKQDLEFKKQFCEENPNNFMLGHEAVYSEDFLRFKGIEHERKYKVAFRKREIEWLVKNNLPVLEIWPDYVPEEKGQMYKLGRRRKEAEIAEIV